VLFELFQLIISFGFVNFIVVIVLAKVNI